jgi:hypothetical protein
MLHTLYGWSTLSAYQGIWNTRPSLCSHIQGGKCMGVYNGDFAISNEGNAHVSAIGV